MHIIKIDTTHKKEKYLSRPFGINDSFFEDDLSNQGHHKF
jgi:hypothetical protein